MRYRLAVLCGRAARWLLRLRGGGSAVPGRVLLALAPKFLERSVSRLPLGLVFVSGSNGKSTTTNILTSILREHDIDVFTNPSGGNLPQGIASAMLASVPLDGYIRGDVGVIEVDEAYGVLLAEKLKPAAVLLLNVQIDQLNRFFEPARVVEMLRKVGAAASELLVVNADDDNLRRIAAELPINSRRDLFFGVVPQLVSDSPHGLANVEDVSSDVSTAESASAVLVTELGDREATLRMNDASFTIALPAHGLHYAADAAGAVAMASGLLLEKFSIESTQRAMATLRTVYGRGETLVVDDEEIEIIMMKNPPSLQLNLDYLLHSPAQVMIAVDEGTPDPSWIYDTDFSNVKHVDVVSGTKAWQIATRLNYSAIQVDTIESDLKLALRAFLSLPRPECGRKTMIVNYEQMMLIRKHLGFLDLEGGES